MARWIVLIIQKVAINRRGHLFFALERRLDNSIKRRTGERWPRKEGGGKVSTRTPGTAEGV